jgi:hypothetical protein
MGERAATVSRGARFSIREEDRPATHALGLINVGRSVTALIEKVFGVHASCLPGPGQSYPVGRPHSIARGGQGLADYVGLACIARASGPWHAALPRRPGPTLGSLSVKRSLLREAFTPSSYLPLSRCRFPGLGLAAAWPRSLRPDAGAVAALGCS